MKSKVSKKGILALLVSLGIITILFVNPDDTTSNQTSITEIDDSDIIDIAFATVDSVNYVTSDNVVFSGDDSSIVAQAFLQSIVNSNNDFINPDQQAIDDYFDSQVDLPEINPDNPEDNEPEVVIDPLTVSERFVLQTVAVLFNSNGEQISDSTLFELEPTISALSLTDSDGNILDLGSIQVGFVGALPFDNNIDFTGNVKFMLDERVLAVKHLVASGKTEDKKIRVNLSDTPTGMREQNFSFTFADEGASWEHQSIHTFKVVVTNLKAQVQNDAGKTKFFSWSGDFTPYKLEMIVDENKQVVYDNDLDQNITVFKDDGKIQITPSLSQGQTADVNVKVKDSTGSLIVEHSANARKVIKWTNWDNQPRTSYAPITTQSDPKIPRNAELIVDITIDGKFDSIVYISPKIQNDIEVSCSKGNSQYREPEPVTCTSNIGWSFP